MENSESVFIFEIPQPETELSELCSEVEHIAKEHFLNNELLNAMKRLLNEPEPSR